MNKIKQQIEQNEREFEEKLGTFGEFIHKINHLISGDEQTAIPEYDIEKIKSHLHTSQLAILKAVVEEVEGMKVANGNYNCGEEGCCNPNPKDDRELNDFEWQIGYNQALSSLITRLNEVLN